MLHDPDILNEETVPEHELVLHRQDTLRRLSRSLSRDSGGDLTYLLGPPGTGKTMCARLQVDKRGGTTGPRSSYVNCWQSYERNDILYQVVDDLVDGVPVHRSSTPRGEVIEHLTREPDEQRFVILDEADQLHDKAILYDLIEAPSLHLVLVANAEDDLFEGINDRLQSRLSVARRIDFEAYSARELSEILAKRGEYAFQNAAVVSDRQLDTIAEHADGDARKAIRSLREAADMAVERGHDRIKDADVEAAIPKAKAALRQKSLNQLNDHQQTVYDIITDEGPISPSDLYDIYCKQVPDPRSQRRVRTYTSKLAHYNLIKADGGTQNRTFQAIGSIETLSR